MPIFIFTDIQKSTQRWEKHREAMSAAMKRHDAIIGGRIEAAGGRIVKHTGDGMFAMFDAGAADNTLQCILDIQRDFGAEDWGTLGELRIRVGLHTGDAEQRGGDFFGPTINRTARVMDVAWGGQILLTAETRQASRLPDNASFTDLGLHQLKDLTEPVHLFMLTHPDRPDEFPPPRSLSTHPNNLPPQTTPFIGRRHELEEVEGIMGPECRVVTVLGPGGMGKTRLGLQYAAEHIDHFKHGVYVVPLAPISSAEDIVPAMADALKYSFTSNEDRQSQMLDYISSKEMLLMMDNFEHVTDGASLVANIVNSAPGVQVLATSRTRLNLAAECIFDLSGMDMPDDEEQEIFETFEAVEMFLTYARRVKPDYVLSESDRPAVVKICKLVGGMPLGIELAASWARMLPPADIAAELEADLDFLATEQTDLPERQRSMRAAFDYSWRMLSEAEQDALAKLSVFRGGFTRMAGQTVTGASLRTLTALADKSLVQWRPAIERYEVHELIRQFAGQMLEAMQQAEAIQDAHSAYYLEAVAAKEEDIKGKAQFVAVTDIAADFENVRAAWLRAVSQQNLSLLGNAAEAFSTFATIYQIRLFDAAELLRHARKITEEDASSEARMFWAKLVVLEAAPQRYSFTPSEATAALERLDSVLDLLHAQNNHHLLPPALFVTGILHTLYGDIARAMPLYEEGLQIVQDSYWESWLLHAAGVAHAYMGNDELADAHNRKASDMRRAMGDSFGLAFSLNNLGVAAYTIGGLAAARHHFEEALGLRRETAKFGDKGGLAWALVHLAEIMSIQGESDQAEAILHEALKLADEVNFAASSGVARIRLGFHALAQNDFTACRQWLEEARAYEHSNREFPSWINVGLALVNCGLGDYAFAHANLKESLQDALHIHTLDIVATGLCAYALLLANDKQHARAAEVLAAALTNPAAKGQLQHIPLITSLQDALRTTLSPDELAAAQERGNTADLATVAGQIVAELEN